MRDCFKPPTKDPPTLIGNLTKREPAQIFIGPYEVYPTDKEQVLHVKGKRMSMDILVHPGTNPIDPYEGSYLVSPDTTEQVLPTEGKTLNQDIVVEAVPVYDGPFEVDPNDSQQILATEGKLLEHDIVVNPEQGVVPDYYDGSYTVKPLADAWTILYVAGKTMREDLYLQPVSSGSYEGSFEVTPSTGAQTLPTKNILMTDDIVVNPVPFSTTGNPGGGYTVTIGS